MTFFCPATATKRSKYCCHPPFHPPTFCPHSLKLLPPTLPILMNWILLSPPPLSSDPDTPQNLERAPAYRCSRAEGRTSLWADSAPPPPSLFRVNTTMSKVLTVLTEIKDKLDTVNKTGQKKNNNKKIEETLSKTADILVGELGKMSVTQAKALTSIVKTSEGNHIKEKVPNWKILLNARKMDYWNHLRNVKIAETYARWCRSDPPKSQRSFNQRPSLEKM